MFQIDDDYSDTLCRIDYTIPPLIDADMPLVSRQLWQILESQAIGLQIRGAFWDDRKMKTYQDYYDVFVRRFLYERKTMRDGIVRRFNLPTLTVVER